MTRRDWLHLLLYAALMVYVGAGVVWMESI